MNQVYKFDLDILTGDVNNCLYESIGSLILNQEVKVSVIIRVLEKMLMLGNHLDDERVALINWLITGVRNEVVTELRVLKNKKQHIFCKGQFKHVINESDYLTFVKLFFLGLPINKIACDLNIKTLDVICSLHRALTSAVEHFTNYDRQTQSF